MKTIYELPDDLNTVKKLLLLFHPEVRVTDEQLAKMIKRGSYNWMQIEGRVTGYGYISLIIDNKNDTSNLWGSGWQLDEFKKRHHRLQFNIFRTSLDKFPTNVLEDYDENLGVFKASESYKLYPLYSLILKDAGYRVMTAREWFDYYYKD